MDQIELPPEVVAGLKSEKPAQPPPDDAAPGLRPNTGQSALPPQAETPPAGLPKAIRTIFLVTIVLTAAVWLIAGALFLLDWLL